MSQYNELDINDIRILQYAPFWMVRLIGGADDQIDEEEIKAATRKLKDPYAGDNEFVRMVKDKMKSELKVIIEELYNDDVQPQKGLEQVAQVLNKLSNQEDAIAYKHTIMEIGIAIAEASKKWLGNNISRLEKKALDQAADILGCEPLAVA